jgi:hypothetical protein
MADTERPYNIEIVGRSTALDQVIDRRGDTLQSETLLEHESGETASQSAKGRTWR